MAPNDRPDSTSDQPAGQIPSWAKSFEIIQRQGTVLKQTAAAGWPLGVDLALDNPEVSAAFANLAGYPVLPDEGILARAPVIHSRFSVLFFVLADIPGLLPEVCPLLLGESFRKAKYFDIPIV